MDVMKLWSFADDKQESYSSWVIDELQKLHGLRLRNPPQFI